jgi:CheY-like chemotaxis protein
MNCTSLLIPISNTVSLLQHPTGPGATNVPQFVQPSERHVGATTELVESWMEGTRMSAGKIDPNRAKDLIEPQDGSIVVTVDGSADGSERIIRLPEKVAATISPAPTADGPNAPAKAARRRILVVDDNEDAARSLAKVLTVLYGQDVRVAHDGPTALESADAFEPEIIFLDIGMPGMSGLELGTILRDRPWSDGCRLAAVTGWGQEKDRERSRAAGFDFHLVKPVRPDALKDILTGKTASWRD